MEADIVETQIVSRKESDVGKRRDSSKVIQEEIQCESETPEQTTSESIDKIKYIEDRLEVRDVDNKANVSHCLERGKLTRWKK